VLLNTSSKTAILVFANSSQEEAKHKKIPKGKALFDALTEQTLKTVEKSDLPYFHFSENEQVGSSFGERFTNAIQTVFDKGYDFIITIGNDTPQLKVSHILETEQQLQSNKFVLGPSTDGGFYLMGLNKFQFEQINFNKLSWQSSSLYKQLFDQISGTKKIVFRLEYLVDIDTKSDIYSILNFANSLTAKIRSFLLQTLNLPRLQLSRSFSYLSSSFSSISYNKGSPIKLHG